MKIRSGFVSNSSSSSFLVGATQKEIDYMEGIHGNWAEEECFDPDVISLSQFEDSTSRFGVESPFDKRIRLIKEAGLIPLHIEVSHHNDELSEMVYDLPFYTHVSYG